MTEMIEFAQARRSPSSNTNGEAEAEVETADPSPGLTFKSAEAGAATQVWAATAAGLEDHNGAYLADCGLGVLGADPGINGYLPYLLDDDRAAALWQLSERLVATAFDL